MLTFMRNKVVGIERRGADTLWVYGVLDDDIYGVELETAVRLSDMVILSIQGKFKRWTTPECPKAIPVLQAAVGLCIVEESFAQRVQKNLGRKGCRHFAALLIECCDAAEKAASLIAGQKPLERIPARTGPKAPRGGGRSEGSPATSVSVEKGFEQRGERETTIIDMHVHTYPASPCSVMRVDQVIEEARRIGLDGICLTDHNHVWDRFQVEELRGKNDGFLILRGNEITTDQGDVIVFGLDTPVPGVILLEELREMVSRAKGFMIAAHPFRGFLTFGVAELGLSVEKGLERPIFHQVDGVEVLNSRVTEKENRMALEVAKKLVLAATGGSDAHQASEVGLCITRFSGLIRDEKDLIEALRTGNHSPQLFRNN